MGLPPNTGSISMKAERLLPRSPHFRMKDTFRRGRYLAEASFPMRVAVVPFPRLPNIRSPN